MILFANFNMIENSLLQKVAGELGIDDRCRYLDTAALSRDDIVTDLDDPSGALPRVLIIDLDSDDADWSELVTALKSDTIWKMVPILGFGFLDDPTTISQFYSLGGSSCIRKPDGYDGLKKITSAAINYWLAFHETELRRKRITLKDEIAMLLSEKVGAVIRRAFFAITTVSATLAIAMPQSIAQSSEQMESVEKGRVLAEKLCGRCHALGQTGSSPFEPAPPFRAVFKQYDPSALEEAFAEGLVVGHEAMPVFEFSPELVGDIIAFFSSEYTN